MGRCADRTIKNSGPVFMTWLAAHRTCSSARALGGPPGVLTPVPTVHQRSRSVRPTLTRRLARCTCRPNLAPDRFEHSRHSG
jgi:hypothetical protein